MFQPCILCSFSLNWHDQKLDWKDKSTVIFSRYSNRKALHFLPLSFGGHIWIPSVILGCHVRKNNCCTLETPPFSFPLEAFPKWRVNCVTAFPVAVGSLSPTSETTSCALSLSHFANRRRHSGAMWDWGQPRRKLSEFQSPHRTTHITAWATAPKGDADYIRGLFSLLEGIRTSVGNV